MDIRRVVLYAALAFVGYSLWTEWQKEYPPAVPSSPVTLTQSNESTADVHPLPTVVPTDGNNTSGAIQAVSENTNPTSDQSQLVHVLTDVLDISIDLNEGDIVGAKLLQFPERADDKSIPFTLLQSNVNERYVANSNLFTVENQAIKPVGIHYQTSQSQYQLLTDQSQLVVTLTGQGADGLNVTKQYTLTRGSYLIQMQYTLQNEASTPWKGYLNTQLQRTNPAESKASLFQVGSYTGASYSNPGVHRFQKVSFKDMGKANMDMPVQGGWVAMQQHYFLSAWIPDETAKNRFYTRAKNQDYTIGFVSSPVELAPSQKATIGARLYVGPEIASTLHAIALGLDLTVDYGWLWFISSMLFSLMSMIYSFIGNWGWSIVLVTVLIKLAFYKLSATSYKSMANMRRLQPRLVALRERYGDDKAKLSQATMEFYRDEKVNPLGGCLPILIQIPVFIGLYWVLIESVQLRQAPFIFWITDLAAADPYHVLPVLMGITMLIQQKLNPAPPDPMQAKIMMLLPVFFTALFWGFPAGLVLYWIVNNTLSILQQWYITRKYSDEAPGKRVINVKSK